MPPVQDLEKEDLYGFLKVDPEASSKDIDKAYRKLALKWHPDKNPDKPEAAKLFQKLVQVYEFLKNKSTRDAYDQVRRARQREELQKSKLDAHRRKLRDDLEARESAHQLEQQRQRVNEETARCQLEAEKKRLAELGAKLVEEAAEKWRQELAKQAEDVSKEDDSEDTNTAIKVKWRKGEEFDEEALKRLLSQFGTVSQILLSSKGRPTAVVAFNSSDSAYNAVQLGCPPLSLSWPPGVAPPAKRKAFDATPAPEESVPARTVIDSSKPLEQMEQDVFALLRVKAQSQQAGDGART